MKSCATLNAPQPQTFNTPGLVLQQNRKVCLSKLPTFVFTQSTPYGPTVLNIQGRSYRLKDLESNVEQQAKSLTKASQAPLEESRELLAISIR